MEQFIGVPQQLLRDLLTEAEEMAERHQDDIHTASELGDDLDAIRAARHKRETLRTIRQARRLLVQQKTFAALVPYWRKS